MIVGTFRTGRARSVLRFVALATACGVFVAGCSSTTEIVGREQRSARFKLHSTPPDAAVYINGKLVAPATPAEVTVPYQQEHRRVTPGTKKTGLLLLLTGLLGLGGGGGITYWGFKDIGSVGTDGGQIIAKTLAASLGIVAVLYGLFGLGGGIYMMASASPPVDVYETTPSALDIRLGLPGLGVRKASLTPDKGVFEPIGTLHYRANLDAWESPGLGAGLKLAPKELSPADLVAMRRPSADPTPAPRTIIAVFDIDVRGSVTLGKELMQRLSDYLAMRLASVPRFKVVPRDQLRKRLAAEKRKSYQRCFDQSCQIEIGKEMAAQKTLSTAIVQLGGSCKVTAVVYDLKSAASEGGATASGACSESGVVSSLEQLVQQLSKTP